MDVENANITKQVTIMDVQINSKCWEWLLSNFLNVFIRSHLHQTSENYFSQSQFILLLYSCGICSVCNVI